MTRHVPIWLDRFPKSRRPSYPKLRGESQTDVVIIGGGLTGCACALSFAAAGVKCVVVEADRIGAAATAGSIGLVREDFDASFMDHASAYGLRAARLLWQGMRRASLDLQAAIRRFEIRCDLVPQELLRLAPRQGDAGKQLEREYRARREAGLDHSWVTAAALKRETSIDASVAIRSRGAALDPYRACLGFASAAAARGAQIFEHSSVRRIRVKRKLVEIATASGSIQADAVVVATGASLADLRALRRHLRPEQGYAVVTEPLPAAVRRELGRRAAALRDSAVPPHILRWLKDDRVMFAGADQPPVASRTAGQGSQAADRSADVRTVRALSGDLGCAAGMGVGLSARWHGGRSSVHRAAPEFSAASVCDGSEPARGRDRVARRARPVAAVSGRTGEGRRAFRV